MPHSKELKKLALEYKAKCDELQKCNMSEGVFVGPVGKLLAEREAISMKAFRLGYSLMDDGSISELDN